MADQENHFAPDHLFGHVKDSKQFEVPRIFQSIDPFHAVHVEGSHAHVSIFQPFEDFEPITLVHTGQEAVDKMVEPLDLKLTKFMILEVVAALVMVAVFVLLGRKLSGGGRPRGRFVNMFEGLLLFLRDEVARPAIGRHDADKFLPFIWTLFCFILGCNLLGMVPWAGSPTGAFAVTGALALITFVVVVLAGMSKLGPIGFWAAQVPHMELPGPLSIFLKPMIFLIEVAGLLIKHFVLAVRLLANMFAGHLVLAVLLTFIAAAWNIDWGLGIWGVMPASVGAAFAMSLLELFVAFLQAYIFTFLTSLFIGMAVHPH